MPTPHERAVLARLHQAYLDVALCETWLAHQEQNASRADRHQTRANEANDRVLELSREEEAADARA